MGGRGRERRREEGEREGERKDSHLFIAFICAIKALSLFTAW